jgi:phosphonopyruvate decarboxylase
LKFHKVYCFDGDGAAIMHLGTMSTIGQNGPSNLKHILFNNGVHDSVGGQPTVAGNEGFSFCKIALGCGYKEVYNLSFKQK